MYGWGQRIIRVNLTEGKINEDALDADFAKHYLGGRGFGIKVLLDELKPDCDPLSPDNILIMATGPLTGTKAPTGARYMVMTKSPLTGALTCSNSGGFFPSLLKKADISMLIFYGRASKPMYLWINQDKVELRNAEHLWGKSPHDTEVAVLQETDLKALVASIGPAGEKLALYATIANDKDRVAGRSGVGAVMGSKNLKAVVVKGERDVPIWNQAELNERVKACTKSFFNLFPDRIPGLRTHGTAVTVAKANAAGCFPTLNYQQGTFDGWKELDGPTLTQKYLKKVKSCYSCPIGCGRVTEVDDPEFAGSGEGPEYETIFSLGSSCGVSNLAAVTKANYIANEMGIDTISLGGSIACAMELSEKGYLPEEDVGIGRKLKFGDAHALVELAKMAGERTGFGHLLSQGSLRLATKYGHPELAMVSKGQETAGYEPRGAQGMGLAYATSPIGASHMRGETAYSEILSVPIKTEPLGWRGKAKMCKDFQDNSCIIDSAGLCVFFSIRALVDPTNLDLHPVGIVGLLNAVTGADYTVEELEKVGERIFNAERKLLVRMGFSRKDDTLPKRFTHESMPFGAAKGSVVHLDEMLNEYYQLRGWTQDGIPTEDKLRELGI